jgi:hypothetical protein
LYVTAAYTIIRSRIICYSALVNAIPAKYSDLAADKKKRVAGQVKNTARVLDDLHDSMDAGKTEEATKELEQVQAALKIIRNQLGN